MYVRYPLAEANGNEIVVSPKHAKYRVSTLKTSVDTRYFASPCIADLR